MRKAARTPGRAGRPPAGPFRIRSRGLRRTTRLAPWLDNWSAEKYVGTIFRDSQEAALVDVAVLRVLRIMHQVGADAPVAAYLEHHGWPEAVRAAREAHVRLAQNDGETPDVPPRSLHELALVNRAV
ncbi:hypothetical protein [Streptomyces sp. NPDC048845]|uniref:SCO4402 family protein n=1 Tax=Streptomyces sp. NPDC048845 TaxID=3155390 RepID=UPI003429615A